MQLFLPKRYFFCGVCGKLIKFECRKKNSLNYDGGLPAKACWLAALSV
jgi:hypothetical protein